MWPCRVAFVAALTASAAGCAPSRAYLFDPVAQTVRERTGLAPEWRTEPAPSAAARRIRELVARPLTADTAALVAVLVLVPVGWIRVLEFVAAAPGDWPFHCHMTHHVMNQMGHDSPVLVGADLADADARIRKLVPGYMTMGQAGTAGMGEMGMPVPDNSVPMKGSAGPFGFIDMGGMFTIVKIRERLSGDPGWYRHPEGTVAAPATATQLRRDGVDVDG